MENELKPHAASEAGYTPQRNTWQRLESWLSADEERTVNCTTSGDKFLAELGVEDRAFCCSGQTVEDAVSAVLDAAGAPQ